MEIYSTEEQQVEAIKSFWKENGTQIILGAVLGLGGFSAWNYYVDKQMEAKEAASTSYESLVKTLSADDVKYDNVTSELAAFTKEHGASGYGVFVQLIAAKQAVQEAQFDKAAEHLTTASTLAEQPSLKDLVTIRLARVEIQLTNYDNALASLATVTSSGYQARVDELKGDIYLAKGDEDQARTSYQAAADNGGLEGNSILEMKLNDLAISKS